VRPTIATTASFTARMTGSSLGEKRYSATGELSNSDL
jgi:hypothetical protein